MFIEEGACEVDERPGQCLLDGGEGRVYRAVFPGRESESCESFSVASKFFGSGDFIVAEQFVGLPDYEQGTGDDVDDCPT